MYNKHVHFSLCNRKKPNFYVECKDKVSKNQIAYIDKEENFTINKIDNITKTPNLEIGVFVADASYDELKIIKFNFCVSY